MDLYDFCEKSDALLSGCDSNLDQIHKDVDLLVSAAQVVSEVGRIPYADQVTDAHLVQVRVAAALIERLATEDISEAVFRIMGKLKALEDGIDALAEWLSQQEEAEDDEPATEPKGRVQ
jgi:hypothetical protein